MILGDRGQIFARELRVNETAYPNLTRLAWAATLVSTLFDIYSSYWGLFLQSMNQVLVGVRIGIVAYVLRLVITGVLLVCGAGLLSMPLGALAGTVVGRWWARANYLHCCRGIRSAERPRPKGLSPSSGPTVGGLACNCWLVI